ncbi:MAG: hypothetical protein KDA21_06210 [Phycisphaerales bacterium]|nr:hypothetical protein [Phycisphaerales bacterium]
MSASETAATTSPPGQSPHGEEHEESRPATPPAWPMSAPPSITTRQTTAQVLEALSNLSRRGRLPGFRRLQEPGADGRGPGRFRVDVFGLHYDREMVGEVTGVDGGARITFSARLLKKMPTIIIAVFVLATWPGAWLTHSMLVTYFGWYPNGTWVTYAWYIPLMLLSIPVLMRQYRVSTSTAHAEMKDVIDKIAKAVDGAVGDA